MFYSSFLNRISKSSSQTLRLVLLGFLFGVSIASLIHTSLSVTHAIVALGIMTGLIIPFWNNTQSRIIALALFSFVIGGLLYSLRVPTIPVSEASQTITARIFREPDVRLENVRYIVTSEDGSNTLVQLPRYRRYQYGDTLQFTCKLQAPEPIEDFRYDRYLLAQGVTKLCWRPTDVAVLSMQGGNVLFAQILEGKQAVAKQINLLWHEPYASFVAGLLYGYRGGLGELDESFRRTGLTHIVAVSGYNISVIVALVLPLLYRLRIPRKKAFWVLTVAILIFVLFAGGSSSVVRAGIMGWLVLLSKYLGRPRQIGQLVLLTAVIMTIVNPFVLIWDAGFQLSFLATIGLIYLSPALDKWLSFLPTQFSLRESAATTLSAIILTLPLQLAQFGSFSTVAPLANILLLWLIPVIMTAGAIAVGLSFLFFPLGQIVSWLAWGLMMGLVTVVEWFAGLSFAAIDVALPAWSSVMAYGLYVVIFVRFKEFFVEKETPVAQTLVSRFGYPVFREQTDR